MKNNIVITGAESFIGTYFKNNLDNYKTKEICLIKNKVFDINFSNTNVVFHVAAIVHQDKTISDDIYYKVNSDLAVEVAEKAKVDGVRQFVFMSTVKVYGENNTTEDPWTENSDCFPKDAYGKSKLDAERRLMALNDDKFLVSIVRTPVVYGPFVKGNIQRIAKFVKFKKIIPFKGIKNKRAMVYIGNLIALIDEIIKQQKSGIFLAGDSNIMSTSELVEYMIKSLDNSKYFIKFPISLKYLIKFLKPNLYNRLFGNLVINNSKTFALLDFKPPFDAEYGIKEVIKSL